MTRTLLLSRVADELDLIRVELDAFGTALCSDPALIEKHLPLLQSLDSFSQRQGQLAMILRGSEPEVSANHVSLDTLRLRLTARSVGEEI